jgi:long-chain acyl-CoA synthetase
MRKPWLNIYPPGTPAEIDPDSVRSLVAMLADSCRRFADRPAFHNLGVTLTYRELDQLSRAFAAYLLGRGLHKGDRVALMMPNILQYPVALFGILRAGLVVVNTNPLYTPRELRHQLQDSGARALIVLENFAHVVAQVRNDSALEHVLITKLGDLTPVYKRVPINFVVRRIRHLVPAYEMHDAISFRDALSEGAQLVLPPVAISAADTAFLQYTGGTTGVAKGAVLTHRNVVANLLQLSAFWHGVFVPGREIMVTPLPLYHVFCLLCNCLLTVHNGGLAVLITNPRDIPAFVSELRKWRFTMITGVNTLFGALLDHPRFSRLDFSALKLGAAGGMALHASVATRWQQVTGTPLVEGYGLTETSPVVACNPLEAPLVGSVGLPLPSTEISIRDGDIEVPTGQPGELCVRGPQVMSGYWNRPEETKSTFAENGWLRTGDIATLAEDGYLRIVDRKKDLIIVSGFKVFPNEIEAVVCDHPAVLDCGCAGIGDERSGQAVKIFVVVRSGVTLTVEELREYCRERLTAYKVPKHIEFRTELPKTHIGKILRRALQQQEPSAAA